MRSSALSWWINESWFRLHSRRDQRTFITHTILGEEYKSFSSSLCNLLHSPVTSSLLGPNVFLNTLFSNTLSFLSSCSVKDQVSHPYKTTGKITVLYILIFKFLDSNLEDKRFYTEWQQAFPDFNLLLISSTIEFWFVPKYSKSSTLSKVLLSILTLWIRPAFWSRDMTMYLVISAFTSSPISLVAATKDSAFSFRVYASSQYALHLLQT